jgi:hypothetical protein
MGQIGNADIDAPYGGDWSFTPQGDFATVADTFDNPAATQQRLYRLILTSPRLKDDNGSPLPGTRPDDLFHPDYGAGLRTIVGESVSAQLLNDAKSRILAALALDTGIVQFPAPAVTATDYGGGYVEFDVSCQTVLGQQVTIPSIPLQFFGG